MCDSGSTQTMGSHVCHNIGQGLNTLTAVPRIINQFI